MGHESHTLRRDPAAHAHGGLDADRSSQNPAGWQGPAAWEELAGCGECGLAVLRLLVHSADWVTRRVERVEFLDDRTVRRHVSVDYCVPTAGRLRSGGAAGRGVALLPIALLRRKSLVNFDLRDQEGHPFPLLGLRENQALALALVRGWAGACLDATDPGRVGGGGLPSTVGEVLEAVAAGDQHELDAAYDRLRTASAGPLAELWGDRHFRAVLDRMSDGFLLFVPDPSPAGTRRIVKYSYDEPLTLRYQEPGYRRGSGTRFPTYTEGAQQPWWHPRGLLATTGLRPMLIRFPVPAAELSASFHFSLTTPSEVLVEEAVILAGRPDVPAGCRAASRPGAPAEPLQDRCCAGGPGRRSRRRPSFDRITGGYACVDLHVADVPYGSLSRVQVALRPTPYTWLATAALSCTAATVVQGAVLLAGSTRTNASSAMLTFTAAIVALLARADPHRMVTRLIAGARILVGSSAVVALLAALLLVLQVDTGRRWWLPLLATTSAVPPVLLWWALLLAVRASRQPVESVWEHHRPPDDPADLDPRRAVARQVNLRLASELEEHAAPYDEADRRLGFTRTAVRVASSEGARERYDWTEESSDQFHRRLCSAPATG